MRIVSFNVNGIRAAAKRGFADWLAEVDADAIGLQEVRCKPADLPLEAFGDYHVVYDPGTLAGRNGVALLTKEPVASVTAWGASAWAWAPGEQPLQLGTESDSLFTPGAVPSFTPVVDLAEELTEFTGDGRWIQADLASHPVRVASLYLPKGGLPERLAAKARNAEKNTTEKYARKMQFLAGFSKQLVTLQQQAAADGRELVVVGDYNIAHQNADLKNWKSNQNNDGFLPEERAWFGEQLTADGFHDVVRELFGEDNGPYSWWSWRGMAFETDAGWRIDYHLATPGLAAKAEKAWVAKAANYDSRVSDHAAVLVDYAF